MQGGWSGREWPISGGVEAGKDAGLSHFELVGKDVMIKNDKKMERNKVSEEELADTARMWQYGQFLDYVTIYLVYPCKLRRVFGH